MKEFKKHLESKKKKPKDSTKVIEKPEEEEKKEEKPKEEVKEDDTKI